MVFKTGKPHPARFRRADASGSALLLPYHGRLQRRTNTNPCRRDKHLIFLLPIIPAA